MHRNKRILYKLATYAAVATLGLTVITGCSNKKGDQEANASGTPVSSATPGSSGNDSSAVTSSAKPNQYLEETILTIDDTAYTLQDLMYIIYMVESEANELAVNAQFMGYDFWEEVDEETGLSGRQLTKDNVIETAKMTHVLYQEALAANMMLSEEDQEYVADEVQYILENTSPEFLTETGFTEDNLKEAVSNYYLASLYYESELEKIEVDEKAIRDEIDYEEYRQSEIEYIYMPTLLYDEEGNEVVLKESQIKDLLTKGNEMLASIKAGKSLEEASEIGKDIEQIEYGTFPTYNDESEMEKSLYDAFNTLKVGEVYDGLIEVEDGYYIIKFLTDESTEEYDTIVEDEVMSQKAQAYSEIYEKLLSKHNATVNEEVWNKITIGNLAFESIDLGFEFEETEGDEPEMEEAEIEGEEQATE